MDHDDLEPIDLEAIPLGELDEYEHPELTAEQRARRHRFVRLGAWGFVVLFGLGVVGTPIVGANSVRSPAPRHLVAPADEGPRRSVASSYSIGETSFIDRRRGFGLATEFSVPPDEWTADGPDSRFTTRFVVTTDGGRSWWYVGPRLQNATSIAFVDAQHGVVASDGHGLRYTTDGGRHWTQTPQILRSVTRAGRAIWAVGYMSCAQPPTCDDRVLRSTDGGRSWTPTMAPSPPIDGVLSESSHW